MDGPGDGDAEYDKVLKSKTKFAGADGADLMPGDHLNTDSSSSANAPIQFERQDVSSSSAAPSVPPKADAYGIDKFLSDSRTKRHDR